MESIRPAVRKTRCGSALKPGPGWHGGMCTGNPVGPRCCHRRRYWKRLDGVAALGWHSRRAITRNLQWIWLAEEAKRLPSDLQWTEVSGTPKTNTAGGAGLGREVTSSHSGGSLNLELPSKDPGDRVKRSVGAYGARTQRRGKSYRDHLWAEVVEGREKDFKGGVCASCFVLFFIAVKYT